MSEAIAEVMSDEERAYLKGLLVESVVKINFTKVDGSSSEILATVNPKFLPVVTVVEGVEPKPKKERKINPDVLSFYSLDRKDWRSVRYDLIKTFEIIDSDLDLSNLGE